MTPEQFVYWLQGYFELENPRFIEDTQTQIIKDHLKLVFNKKTPFRHALDEKDLELLKEELKLIDDKLIDVKQKETYC